MERNFSIENFNQVLQLGQGVAYHKRYRPDAFEFSGDQIEAITGYPAEELTPALWRSLTVLIEQHEEYADFTLEETQRRFREGQIDSWKADMQIRTRSGEKRWLSDSAVAVRDDSGKCIGCMGILMDITERKEAQRKMSTLTNQLQRRNEEMENDLIMASEVQQAFVTEQPCCFPLNDPCLNFHHRYIPAAMLAGDFYEILPLSEQKVGIFICDVVGHGVRAALLTTFLRGLLEELVPMGDAPGALLSKLNRSFKAVFGQTENFLFATSCFVVFDLQQNRLQFANAGHPDPLLLDMSTGDTKPLATGLERSEPALGILEEFPFTTIDYELHKNECLFLFTDGLIEAYDEYDNMFGERRLMESLQRNHQLDPESLLDETFREIYEFAKADELEDDACLLAIVPA